LGQVLFAIVHHVVGHGVEPEFSEEDGQHLAGLRGVDLVSFHSFGLSIFSGFVAFDALNLTRNGMIERTF
jgi:hypothetical protein